MRKNFHLSLGRILRVRYWLRRNRAIHSGDWKFVILISPYYAGYYVNLCNF
jgi:hypothetical protein